MANTQTYLCNQFSHGRDLLVASRHKCHTAKCLDVVQAGVEDHPIAEESAHNDHVVEPKAVEHRLHCLATVGVLNSHLNQQRERSAFWSGEKSGDKDIATIQHTHNKVH